MRNVRGKIVIRSTCSGICTKDKRGIKLLEKYGIGKID